MSTGLLCPIKRLKIAPGEHKIEIYDAVTDSTQTHEVNGGKARRSIRIRVDSEK